MRCGRPRRQLAEALAGEGDLTELGLAYLSDWRAGHGYLDDILAAFAKVLRVTQDDDDGVIGVDDDRMMRTAPLGVVSGAVVGVVTGCPSC